MFQVHFSNVGHRVREATIQVHAETLAEAEKAALFECRKILLSNNVKLCHVRNLTYEVIAGFCVVGQVKIRGL